MNLVATRLLEKIISKLARDYMGSIHIKKALIKARRCIRSDWHVSDVSDASPALLLTGFDHPQ